ncbi:MAG: alpha/beta fold hydrolase [Bacteroidota bacterium]
MSIAVEALSLEVGRTHALSYVQYLPETEPKKVLLISSATAVPQQYYKKFASYFAKHRFATYTFDYSGFGDSGNSIDYLRSHTGGVIGWGAIDQAAMVKLIQKNHPELKIVLVAHSIGGQIAGFNPLNTAFEKVIMVASQSGYWKTYTGLDRVRLGLFWYFFIPVFTPVFGYYPGKRIGIVDNLPKSVVKEWRKWGVKKEYFMQYYNEREYYFDTLKVPLRMFSFTNDSFASKKGVDWLTEQYKNAQVERIHYDKNAKGKRPGHFGFFKETFKEEFWKPALNWLTT